MNLHFDDRDLVCEWESEDQPLTIQLPFRLILHVGYLHFDGYWTLVPAQEFFLRHETVLGL